MKLKNKDYLFVFLQFLLFIAFIFDFNWSLQIGTIIQKMGLYISCFGGLLIILALLQLNKNLSPFPTPKKNGTLLQSGLYKYSRHPIYTGIIVLFFGYSIYQNSMYKLLITIILIVLFYFKSSYEEQRLTVKFPDYPIYKNRTGRFFPFKNLFN